MQIPVQRESVYASFAVVRTAIMPDAHPRKLNRIVACAVPVARVVSSPQSGTRS